MRTETKIKNFVQLRNVVNSALQERAAKRKAEIEAKLRAEKVFKTSKKFGKIYQIKKGIVVASKRKFSF